MLRCKDGGHFGDDNKVLYNDYDQEEDELLNEIEDGASMTEEQRPFRTAADTEYRDAGMAGAPAKGSTQRQVLFQENKQIYKHFVQNIVFQGGPVPTHKFLVCLCLSVPSV